MKELKQQIQGQPTYLLPNLQAQFKKKTNLTLQTTKQTVSQLMWALSLKPASSWNWYRGFSTSTCLARFLRGTLGSATGASWIPLLRLYTNRSGSRKQFVLQFLKKVDWVLATRDMSQVKPSGTTPFSWLSFTPTFALGPPYTRSFPHWKRDPRRFTALFLSGEGYGLGNKDHRG